MRLRQEMNWLKERAAKIRASLLGDNRIQSEIPEVAGGGAVVG
jgi:hypothetical protein